MAGERNRIIAITKYLESLGIEVKIGKNKARGNKGFFRVGAKAFRIDIAKGQQGNEIIKTLVHEFAHFIHYSYDNTLQTLSFIIDENNKELIEELLELTVDSIPKSSVLPIFETKEKIKNEIKDLTKTLENIYPDIKISKPYLPIEQKIKKTNFRYLLTYDKVKVIEGFTTKLYSIDNIETSDEIKKYLKLKSLQRSLKRINSKISRLNKYYNSPTELFARAFEIYFTNLTKFKSKAPKLLNKFNNTSIPEIKKLEEIFLQEF